MKLKIIKNQIIYQITKENWSATLCLDSDSL